MEEQQMSNERTMNEQWLQAFVGKVGRGSPYMKIDSEQFFFSVEA